MNGHLQISHTVYVVPLQNFQQIPIQATIHELRVRCLPELNTIFTAEALHIMQEEGKVDSNKGKLVLLTTLILVLWHTLKITGI